MREDTVAILKRLSKGKAALTPEQLVAFCSDLASASADEVRNAVAKKVTTKKAAAPKPQWLASMEADKKRLTWSAAEAARKLIEMSIDEGFIPAGKFDGLKKPPLFSTAAKTIAKEVGGDRLASAYSREISRLEKEFRLG